VTHLQTIQKGLMVVRDALTRMEEDVLGRQFGDAWWKAAVLAPLSQDGKTPHGWPEQGNAGDLDLQTALKLIQVYHWELFSDTFDWNGRERTLLNAMIAVRNQYEGHVTPNRERELTAEATEEILEGMARFVRLFDGAAARQIDRLEAERKMEPEAAPPATPNPSGKAEGSVRRVPEAAPAEDIASRFDIAPAEDVSFAARGGKRSKDSGYRSIWEEEEDGDAPITFYSRKKAEPPKIAEPEKRVLYHGVRLPEEEREEPVQGRYAALNYRETKQARQDPPREHATAPKDSVPPVLPRKDPPSGKPASKSAEAEPFPVAKKIAKPQASAPVVVKGKPWWEERDRAPDELRRQALTAAKPKRLPSEKEAKPPFLSVRQTIAVAAWILFGIVLAVGFLYLDRWVTAFFSG